MSTPKRYASGVANRGSDDFFGTYVAMDPTRVITFFDDFIPYIGTKYLISTVEAGLGGSATEVMGDEDGGVLVVTNDNAAGDHDHFMLSGDAGTTANEPFLIEAGKKFWLSTRFKTADADQNAIVVGLHEINADPWDSEPTDVFYFRSSAFTATNTATIQFKSSVDGSNSVTTTVKTLADDTYTILEAYYDGLDTVHLWADGAKAGTADVTNSTRGDLLPNQAVGPAFGMECTDTGADAFTIDWIFAAKER